MEPEASKANSLVEQWYWDYRDPLGRFLGRGVRSADDVNDLSQEVFLRLLRVPRPDLVRKPRAYVYRIAVHVLAEWRGKQRRSGLKTPTNDAEPRSNGESPAVFDIGDALDIRRALRALPSAQAATLVLHWHYGMTYREIATELNVTERMVKRYVVKGYATLRKLLDEREGSDDH